MLEIFTKNWWIFVVRGLLAMLFGILALLWPGPTLFSLVILFGVFVLLEGLLNLLIGIASSETKRRWWLKLIEGFIGIGIAILTFFWPGITAVVLLSFIAIWALFTGIMEIIAAIRLRRMIQNELVLILNGILSILFSGLLFIFPGEGAISLIWLIGIFAIIIGVLLVVLGFRLRKFHREEGLSA